MKEIITNSEALVLAAGKGVRMCSDKPKVLHEVCGQSLVGRTLNCLSEAGLKNISVVIGSGAELVRAEIESVNSNAKTVLQTEQLGTGHAVQVALPELSKDYILILPGDVPLLKSEIIEAAFNAVAETAADLLVLTFFPDDPAAFGRMVRDADGNLQGIKEAKDCSEEELEIAEVNSGIYLLKRELLEKGLQGLSSDNAQGEIYLTDIVSYGAEKGYKLEGLAVEDPSQLAGANNRAELSELELFRRLEIAEELMLSGVGVESPAELFVDEGVRVGKDSFLGAGVHLKGQTTLGEGVVVQGYSSIENSQIASGAKIKFSSVIEDSEVGANSNIGPFAHLRPGSMIGKDVKVGNFVETKKAILKDGVKAGHLSYLGDATIEEEVNIGAGTITCNYDGKNKHKTEIGKNSFIGSNSCLVAPVKVGEEAYIGAGSVITKEVPSKALGIGRAKQSNKENWAGKDTKGE